eukprot:TRINITY_DN11748_c0_g1_i1.p1 TRINITY_DN11748_c0_g1~~TRINITY_DN11748_c0_g1_i1.p1  ORF type:complete len:726 (-),score=155.75 TRINITY_DN11748_c0_g1_i1:267-2444(-)
MTEQRRSSKQQRAREHAAAVVLQRMYRQREASLFVSEKRRVQKQMQALVVMTVDVCELALWLHYWKTRKQDAAVQIQNIARGRRGRTIAAQRDRMRKQQAACASLIQRRARGMSTRSQVIALREKKERCATRLQAIVRGFLGRARFQQVRMVRYLTDAADPFLQREVVAGSASGSAQHHVLSSTVQRFVARAQQLEAQQMSKPPDMLTLQMVEKQVARKYDAVVVGLAAHVRELQQQVLLLQAQQCRQQCRTCHPVHKAPAPEEAIPTEELTVEDIPGWFSGPSAPQPAEQAVEPISHQPPVEQPSWFTRAHEAAVVIQSVCRLPLSRQRRAAATRLARAIRKFIARKRLLGKCLQVEAEAFQMSRDCMLECEKVLQTSAFFDSAPNAAVEKWRLVKALVSSKRIIRSLFVHYSARGLTHPSLVFRLSQLQWLSLCTEGGFCQNFDHRITDFQRVFEHVNQGTEPFIPPDVTNHPSHMMLCEFVQALLQVANLWFPSARGRITDSWRELVLCSLQPLAREVQQGKISGLTLQAVRGGFDVCQNGWPGLEQRMKDEIEVVFRYFGGMDGHEEQEQVLDVKQFMEMISSLELIDSNLNLQMCVSIFAQCNLFEIEHFVGTAVSGYKLEARLQMSFIEFIDALHECSVVKCTKSIRAPLEAFVKFVALMSSGWHRFKAHQVLRKARCEDQHRWKNEMCTRGAQIVQPLQAGDRRIVLPVGELPSTQKY